MFSFRCLALTMSLLALQVPARAQLPPSAAYTFLGRTPESGFTTTLLVGTAQAGVVENRGTCHETVMRHVSRYGDENRISCRVQRRNWIYDYLSLEAGAHVWPLHEDTPGQYWLSAAVDVSLTVHSIWPDIAGEVISGFDGYGSAWATDGIMFRANEDIRVTVEQDRSLMLGPDERVRVWIERCDASGCTVLRELKEKLPWIIELPANQLPAQQTVNPGPNASEHYRISTSVYVMAHGSEPDYLRDGDAVVDSAEAHISVSIGSPGCIPGTAGC
jgi:hypothetical protein